MLDHLFVVFYHTAASSETPFRKEADMDTEALHKMTVAELREEARKLGDVKGIASMKKDELVQLLAGDASDAPVTGDSRGKSRSKGGAYQLPALKQRVRELKAKRATATSKGQKAKVTEFNSDLRTLRRHLRRVARKRRKSS